MKLSLNVGYNVSICVNVHHVIQVIKRREAGHTAIPGHATGRAARPLSSYTPGRALLLHGTGTLIASFS